VGDLAGPLALRAIGAEIRRHGLTVRGLYASNVEYHLLRNGTFDRFAEDVQTVLSADGCAGYGDLVSRDAVPLVDTLR